MIGLFCEKGANTTNSENPLKHTTNKQECGAPYQGRVVELQSLAKQQPLGEVHLVVPVVLLSRRTNQEAGSDSGTSRVRWYRVPVKGLLVAEGIREERKAAGHRASRQPDPPGL